MNAAPTPAEIAAAKRIVAVVMKTYSDLGYPVERAETVAKTEAALASLIAEETGGTANLDALNAVIHEFEGDSGTGVSYWEDKPVYINAVAAAKRLEGRK